MDHSTREQQASGAQHDPKRFLVSLPSLGSILQWLSSLVKLTEEEQKQAGTYRGRVRPE